MRHQQSSHTQSLSIRSAVSSFTEPAEDSDTGQQVAYYDSDDSDATHVDTQILVKVGYLETDTTLEADDHSSDTDDEDTYENWCEKYNQL
ncbi:hypothetical protein Pcinc_010200 [Petrolisthes cinctipes]|uniref:Uncharacterized protein n=1 Tax=Petrolisthes cinctipes TaxID=88211 RepID=A0AAE1KUR3_PETCI|nr:hypothetical protein Pcinc_010200 [Petrolisthes cinctipes]